MVAWPQGTVEGIGARASLATMSNELVFCTTAPGWLRMGRVIVFTRKPRFERARSVFAITAKVADLDFVSEVGVAWRVETRARRVLVMRCHRARSSVYSGGGAGRGRELCKFF